MTQVVSIIQEKKQSSAIVRQLLDEDYIDIDIEAATGPYGNNKQEHNIFITLNGDELLVTIRFNKHAGDDITINLTNHTAKLIEGKIK